MRNTALLLKKDMKEKRELVNIEIDRFLPRKDEYPKQIHKAIRHTLFAGGKRLRPYLLINTYELFATDMHQAYVVAGIIEMIHTYTLIHDDLPEIDNDEYRRGRKTCHVVYGSDIALLAGDALLVYAFQALAESNVEESLRLKMIEELAREIGYKGLIAGQMADIENENKKVTAKKLEYIHRNKTARLLTLSIRFACYLANTTQNDQTRMERFGEKLGLAFQIIDDVLDVEGNLETLGKSTGKDKATNKATYPAVYGLENSKTMAQKLITDAKELLKPYGEKAETLQLLADFILTRKL
jgi:geranylgeranyl diphosphate synthase, type II